MEQDGYLQAYNKKCQLLEDTPSPRIIFVGGSNLAFGLDSQRIKDSLNINVINYGLHAGIGLKYMMMTYPPMQEKVTLLYSLRNTNTSIQ